MSGSRFQWRLGIFPKMFLAMILPLLIFFASASVMFHYHQSTSANLQSKRETYRSLMLSSTQMLQDFYRWDGDLNMAVMAAADHQDAMTASQLADATKTRTTSYKDLQHAVQDGMPAVDGQRLTREFNAYLAFENEVVNAIHKGDVEQATYVQLVANEKTTNQITNDLSSLEHYYDTQFVTNTNALEHNTRELNRTLRITTLLFLLIALLVAAAFGTTMVRGIKRFIMSLKQVAEGERDPEVFKRTSSDEIGDAFEALMNTVQALNIAESHLQRQLEFQQVLLNNIPVPVFYIGTDGRYKEVNQAFEQFYGVSTHQVIGKVVSDDVVPTQGTVAYRAEDWALASTLDGRVSEEMTDTDAAGKRRNTILYKTPVHGPMGFVEGVIGVIIDITEEEAVQQYIQQLNKMYSALSQINQLIVRRTDEPTLLDEVCHIAVTHGGMEAAFVGVLDKTSRRIELFSSYCETDTMKSYFNLLLESDPDENGPIGLAFRENRPVIIQNYGQNPRILSEHNLAVELGIKSTAVFPIMRGNDVYAVLILSHSESDMFDTRTTKLFTEMINDVSYGLDQVDLEKKRKLDEKQLRLIAQVFEQSHEGIVITNDSGDFLAINHAFTEITGYTESEVLGKATGRQSKEFYMDIFQQSNQPNYWEGQVWNRRKDGSEYLEHLTICKVSDADGRVTNYISIMTDITEQKRAEEALRDAENRFRTLFEESRDAIMTLELPDWTYSAANSAAVQLFGVTDSGAFASLHPWDLSPEVQPDGQLSELKAQTMLQMVLDNGSHYFEWNHRRIDGHEFPSTVLLTKMQVNGIPLVEATIRDITEQREADREIQRLAHYDSLTNLPNRALLSHRVDQALAMAQQDAQQVTLMFLDLDNFKNINDTYGHHVGDRLLVDVAGRLKTLLRHDDTVARLGGDEFILLLPNSGREHATWMAEQILQQISMPFQTEGHELITTPSIGISVYPLDGTDWSTLYRHADISLYRAKSEGRNVFRFFTPEMQLQSRHRRKLELALRGALKRGEFILHYQPQISTQTQFVVGLEALLRWHSTELGLVSPAEFIPIAEESGLIFPIGEWVLRTAIQQIRAWRDSGQEPLRVSINVSAMQMLKQNFPQEVLQILTEEGVSPELLELELTETVAMRNPQAAINMMNLLHEHGVKISIDDFGTGYSSLAQLKRFPVDKLKIDQSFVHGIEHDSENVAIVTAIIKMCHTLRIFTIAEGVESKEELSMLNKMGCDGIQGYYFSRPVPATEFTRWLLQGQTR